MEKEYTSVMYDAESSRMNEETLAKFLAAPLSNEAGRLEDIPGIGPKTAECLSTESEDMVSIPIETPLQLLGWFLSMRAPGMSSEIHLSIFMTYLKNERKISANKHTIAQALHEKCCHLFPGQFDD